jgi:hypothetical protein
MAKTFKFPKSMGVCADRLYELRNKRIEEQKKVDLLQAEETALKNYIIDTLPKSELSGASGKKANVKIKVKDVPQIQDIDALYTYIRRSKRSDLLQKRLNEAAITEILDSGKSVPGIGVFPVTTISLTKVS